MNQNSPAGIAIDTANVYWTNIGTSADSYMNGSVMSVPIATGTVALLASGQAEPGGIALYPTGSVAASVYWTNTESPPGTVMKWVPGGVTTLASGLVYPTGIVTDTAGNVYWTTFDDAADQEGADQGDGGQVWRTAAGTTTSALLASNQAGTSELAIDATNLYWTNNGSPPDFTNGSVVQLTIPIAGAAPGAPLTLALNQSIAGGIAIDAANVYWTTGGTSSGDVGTVAKVAIGGGPVTILASGFPYIANGGIAVDATSVYWVNGYSGTVMKVTPK
jgi:hypothetical protein